jgi:hypothetical protein
VFGRQTQRCDLEAFDWLLTVDRGELCQPQYITVHDIGFGASPPEPPAPESVCIHGEIRHGDTTQQTRVAEILT